MRHAAKVDANQEDVVKALRDAGATVQILSAVGKGCPDLLAGWRNRNFLLEIKDGSKAPCEQKLTSDQIKWHESWAGQVTVVRTPKEAVDAVVKAAQ